MRAGGGRGGGAPRGSVGGRVAELTRPGTASDPPTGTAARAVGRAPPRPATLPAAARGAGDARRGSAPPPARHRQLRLRQQLHLALRGLRQAHDRSSRTIPALRPADKV